MLSPYKTLVGDTAQVLFPAGIPQLSGRVKVALFASIISSALLLTLLVAQWMIHGISMNMVIADAWVFQAGGLFLALASVSLYMAQYSWKHEAYRAHRDRLIVTGMAASSFLLLQLIGIISSLEAEGLASLLATIQLAYLAHFALAYGVVLWALKASLQHSTAITGYILRLRPGVEQRMRLLGVLWAGNALLWLYLQVVL